ncbi:hypothetical protein [Polaromonas sp.]|uniref:hypothetical protein n=1 Tax=Polaromonas sp. TaxID=1869339 RepID=UPI00273062E9|nr:hypothetical protein [Polaromonas sp.]MDP1742455.1 hypothetical protein [Polaromonas sp.]
MKKIISTALVAIMVLAVSATSGFAAEKAKAAAHANYWDGWTKVYSLDMFPECGVNVLGAGGDDILQETVDVYCGVKPGGYVAYINPKVMDIYKKKGKKYPDGKLGVLVFEKIGAVFTSEIKDGKPIFDVVAIADGKSIASKEKGHPLNPQVCSDCHHTAQDGVCKKHGFVCGDVNFRTK